MATTNGDHQRFQKGDLIIPKKDLKDKNWRAAVIRVDEHFEDGTITGFSAGGGFALRIHADKARQLDFVKVPRLMLQHHVFYRARFEADWTEGKSYEGWTTGQLWNGWGMPYFEPDVATEVVADLEGWSIAYDSQKDEYSLVPQSDPEEEPYVVPAETIEVVDDDGRVKEIKAYGIGAGYFTWEAAKPPEGRSEEEE